MSESKTTSADGASYSSSQPENGFIDSASPVNSEKAIRELLQRAPVHDNDEHLIEFSEALRTVAKALRRAAEGKASAQAEAAEWKRKYKLERARNQDFQQQDKISGGKHDDDIHCERHGIWTHEVLFNGENDSASRAIQTRMMRKASFKLSWWCKGERSDQHKHDIVSFEKGNITTAGRTSKQIALKWESPPQTVLIVTKPNSNSVRVLCVEMVRWLKDHNNLNIYVEPSVRSELLTDSSSFKFVQTWQDESEIPELHKKVDLVVTLGGDGTVLWAASMFKGPVPPCCPLFFRVLGLYDPFLQ
ncbi:hypothetical protein NL676_004464 [Syzygium grande]|nr:hypothetical protein NL676_004464 [Syzygium grande]